MKGAFEPPVGRYQGADGFLELSYETVTVCKENLPQPVESVLAYGEIDSMVFREATEECLGYLAVRDVSSDSPPVKTESDAAACETAILFDIAMNGPFREAYAYLEKNIPPAGKKAPRRPKPREICCPRCGSKRYQIHRFSRFISPYNKHSLTRLICRILILYSIIFLEGKKLECQNCGYCWFP